MADKQLREVTCTCCPTGCTLVVELSSYGEAVYVSGAGCARGKSYGPAELTHPERVVTTTVCVPGVAEPLSVRTSAPVPKGLMACVVAAAKAAGEGCSVPIALGDVIVANVCDTGVDVIATRAVG